MQITFENEDTVISKLQETLGERFDFARRLLRVSLKADVGNAFNSSDLHNLTLVALHTSLCRVFRQFRTVIELCERGEAEDAAAISRGIFETSLAVAFVLNDRVKLRTFDEHGKGHVVKWMKEANRPMSREFRAELFNAHQRLDGYRYIRRNKNRPGMKRECVQLLKQLENEGVRADVELTIGAEWTTRFTKSDSFACISIADLARSIGGPFTRWYSDIYSDQSSHVHFGDALSRIDLDVDAGILSHQWHSTIQFCSVTLDTAIAMFIHAIGNIHIELDLGPIFDMQLEGLHKEHMKRLKRD